MVHQNFKTEVSNGVQAAALFVLSAACLWFFLGRKLRYVVPVWLIVTGGSIAACIGLYDAGYVLHPLWLTLTITVFFVGAVAFNYVQAALEKRKVSNTFKRYVAPEIVGELLREGTDSLGLGGKLCDIAVLFVDIRGFTTMSEVLTPQEVVSILNRYLTLPTDCIMKNHGTLDKFVGDCTMAIWNAPIPQEDYVMNTCKAALDMVEGSKALSQELLEKFGRTVSFGIGVHCGSAVVGNIGAEMRMDFTAIGDTGNHAIRAMDQKGKVTTYAGGTEGCALGAIQEARFSEPTGLCEADGVLYVADTGNHRVVAIADGQVTLVAGAEQGDDAAYLNDVPEKACCSSPQGVTVGQDGTVYIADTGNSAVRAVQNGYVSTLMRMDSGAPYPASPRGLLLDGDTLYVGDIFSRTLLAVTAQVPAISFQDVAEDAWYAPAVRFTVANELFQGTGEGVFSPDTHMSRAMIWTVLARFDGVDTAGGDAWYAAGRDWAVETGVSDGSNPEDTITREQLAVMLYRYVQSKGSTETGIFPLKYDDADQVSDYAYDAVCWMITDGILNSVGENRLNPQGEATRAEVAAVLMRFCEQAVSIAS